MTPEQREAILKDAEVAEALYKLATEGFNFTETKELKDADGKVFQIETMTRHVPPSVEAAIFIRNLSKAATNGLASSVNIRAINR
jgi:hypothetical protein